MRRFEIVWRLMLSVLILGTPGCGTFMARRMTQAPNTYPKWFAPKAHVMLAFSPKFMSSFPLRYVEVGPPSARLAYRIVEPADYQFNETSSNWVEKGKQQYQFNFKATFPGRTNAWSTAPRGTVIVLHGYGLAQFAMAPWAVQLAEEGWRCVLVDLRGHGKSSGRQIYYGVHETLDLSQLLDQLTVEGHLAGPVSVIGESYGGALALRWKTEDPRVGNVVAIAPYAILSTAMLNLSHVYEGWVPRTLSDALLKSGLRQLPTVLHVKPEDLDTLSVITRHPESALIVAAADDQIMPLADEKKLSEATKPGSELIVVPNAAHETVAYFFTELEQPVVKWLERPPE